LTQSTSTEDTVFSPFTDIRSHFCIPEGFTSPFNNQPHPLSRLAVEKLQFYLTNQSDWHHNFGLSKENGPVIGKMFGVLVVRTEDNQVGYLSAFSGKLAGKNHHEKFVPPLFDGVAENGFLNAGMEKLSVITEEIRKLENQNPETNKSRIAQLKTDRKTHSITLQNRIFDEYHFLNQAGTKKSLRQIFLSASFKNPPAGAGECAAPKLLQYAFQNNMQPLAIAEFWWGLSPKSATWKHGHFYPSCKEKCAPILDHMLEGLQMEERAEL